MTCVCPAALRRGHRRSADRHDKTLKCDILEQSTHVGIGDAACAIAATKTHIKNLRPRTDGHAALTGDCAALAGASGAGWGIGGGAGGRNQAIESTSDP